MTHNLTKADKTVSGKPAYADPYCPDDTLFNVIDKKGETICFIGPAWLFQDNLTEVPIIAAIYIIPIRSARKKWPSLKVVTAEQKVLLEQGLVVLAAEELPVYESQPSTPKPLE